MYYRLNWSQIWSSSSRTRAVLVILLICQNLYVCQAGLSSSLTDDDLYQLINLATTGQNFQRKPEIYYAEPDHVPNHGHGADQNPVTNDIPPIVNAPPNTHYNAIQPPALYGIPNFHLGPNAGVDGQLPLQYPNQLMLQYRTNEHDGGADRYLDGKKRSSAIEIVSSLELPSEHTQYHEDASGGLVKILPQPEEQQQLTDLSQTSQSKLVSPITVPVGNHLSIGNSLSGVSGVPASDQLISHNHLLHTHQPQQLQFPIFNSIIEQKIQPQGSLIHFGLPPPAAPTGPGYTFSPVVASPHSAPSAPTGPLLDSGITLNSPTSLPVTVNAANEPYHSSVPLGSVQSQAQPQLVQVADPAAASTSVPVQHSLDHLQVHQQNQQSHQSEHQRAVQQQLLGKSTPATITRHVSTPNESNNPIPIQTPQFVPQHQHPQFVHQPQPIQYGQPVLQNQQLAPQVVPQIHQLPQQQPLYTYGVPSPDNRMPLFQTVITKYHIPNAQNVHPQQHLLAQPQQLQFNFLPYAHPTQHPGPIVSNGAIPAPTEEMKERITEIVQEAEGVARRSVGKGINMSTGEPLTASEEMLINQAQQERPHTAISHRYGEPIVTMQTETMLPQVSVTSVSPSQTESTGHGLTRSVVTTRVVTHYKKPFKNRSILRATLDNNSKSMKVMETSA